MIALLLENVPFEQDIRELFMAFFPSYKYVYDREAKITLRAKKEEKFYKFEIIFLDENVLNSEKVKTYSFEVEIYETRFETKNEIKRNLYSILNNYTSILLPWGTLTGIRPTKIAMEKLENGYSRENIIKYLKTEYYVSDEKAKLCTDTAISEQRILQDIDYLNGWSLYIGIPFCPTRCVYCSFTAYPIEQWEREGITEDYIDALCYELEEVSELMRGKKLQSIYMGGGTPTSLTAIQLDKILNCIMKSYDLTHLLEFTIEAGRPDSITKDKLKVMKKHGVDRISINPQTMKDETLRLIGRNHNVAKVIEQYKIARKLGFKNINMDLIMGLPNEDIEDVKSTLRKIKTLAPDSLTIHSLAIKRAARLNTDKENYTDFQIQNTWEMLYNAQETCKSMGLMPYYLYRQKNMAGNFENVGYSKLGKECIYNILIMEEKQSIIACGAGTSTKLVFKNKNRIERVENVKDPALYIERIDEMIERKIKGLRSLETEDIND